MNQAEHARAVKILAVIFAIAVVASIVHYTDNYLAFDRFPQSDSGPQISKNSVWISWILFTTAGVSGYVLFRRRQLKAGLALLVVYSFSGLIGIGHYTASAALDLAWWRHIHVGLDFLSGLAMFSFCVWALLQLRQPADAPA